MRNDVWSFTFLYSLLLVFHAMFTVSCCRMTRFEKTNEMLLNFNRLSDARYELTQTDFKKHIHLLHDMRKDLDNIFRRIRSVMCFFCNMFRKSVTAWYMV